MGIGKWKINKRREKSALKRNSPYKQKGKKGKKGKTRITKEDVEQFPALRGAYEAQERATKGGTLDENDMEYWDRREHRSGPTAPKKPKATKQESYETRADRARRAGLKGDAIHKYASKGGQQASPNTTEQGYYHEKPERGNRRYPKREIGKHSDGGDFHQHRADSGERHHDPIFEETEDPNVVTRKGSGYIWDDEHEVHGKHADPKVQREKAWHENWFNHPATKERWKTLGGDEKDLQRRVKQGAAAEIVPHNPNPDAAGTYNARDHRIRFNPGEAGYDSLAHEYAHATGIDKDQGQILEDILGKPKAGTANQKYYSRGPEMYGWIQDIRKDMGVKPGQKITRKMLEQSGSRDFKQLSKRFDPEKIAKAMNTVAYEKGDGSKKFKDLPGYEAMQDKESAFARKSPFTRMSRTKKYWCK